jgi:hypothetical protein
MKIVASESAAFCRADPDGSSGLLFLLKVALDVPEILLDGAFCLEGTRCNEKSV